MAMRLLRPLWQNSALKCQKVGLVEYKSRDFCKKSSYPVDQAFSSHPSGKVLLINENLFFASALGIYSQAKFNENLLSKDRTISKLELNQSRFSYHNEQATFFLF